MNRKAIPTGRQGFLQIILIGAISVVVLAGAGGFLIFREKKLSSLEKTVPQDASSQKTEGEAPLPETHTIEDGTKPTFPALSVRPPKPKTQPELKPKPAILQEIKPKPAIVPSPSTINSSAIPQAPINLALPLVVADIKEVETVLSPYGIIRKSGDGGIGHGGIDFPLRKGSPLYAVAAGTIIKNNLEDSGGGKTVDILIMPGKFQGDGWIFKYDHVNLTPGLKVGDNVKKGQQIGTNAFVERGNNHIGLEYHIRNFTIAREKICWVDRLEVTARQQLENEFNRIKKTSAFLQFWQTANDEGYYQYKGLLDESKYPNGPQLCYPLGTDARIPIH